MNHPLRCRCGTLKGHVSHPEKASRGVCYCKDSQAFARLLGTTDDILDDMGGTDVLATLPKYTPFFVPDRGTPVVPAKVLTRNERERVTNAV